MPCQAEQLFVPSSVPQWGSKGLTLCWVCDEGHGGAAALHPGLLAWPPACKKRAVVASMASQQGEGEPGQDLQGEFCGFLALGGPKPRWDKHHFCGTKEPQSTSPPLLPPPFPWCPAQHEA